MDRLEQLEQILGGHEEASNLLETIDMLEDKMDNQHDEVAKDFYLKISGAVQELQTAVYEAKNFYE